MYKSYVYIYNIIFGVFGQKSFSVRVTYLIFEFTKMLALRNCIVENFENATVLKFQLCKKHCFGLLLWFNDQYVEAGGFT